MQTTYSFLDTTLIFAHPDAPVPITITGEGAGRVTVSMDGDRTAMDQAADGAVMVSKMAATIGTVMIDVQQTSQVHKKLLALFNTLYIADTSAWAKATITIRNSSDGTGHVCTGVAFSKPGDKVYQKDGQHVSWTLKCADIQNLTV
jgi:hypothetical protein